MLLKPITPSSLLKPSSKKAFYGAVLTILALVLSWSSTLRADEYSAGMKAYMSGDYELAKTLWMEGAEVKDAKSMFNLGLLHEQDMIKGAGFERAEKWYRLAGENGYPAADYHLAQLLANKGERQRQSRELLQRSAANGYSPARNKLGQVSSPELKAPVRASREYQNQQWIDAQRTSNWTIQMLAFDDLKKVQNYIDQHSLHNKAAYFAEPTAEGLLYKLVYGSFADKQMADKARQELPNELKTNGPWLRSIASIQKSIAK